MALRRAGISEACGGRKGISHGGEGLSKGLNMGKYLRKGQEQFEGRIDHDFHRRQFYDYTIVVSDELYKVPPVLPSRRTSALTDYCVCIITVKWLVLG